MSAHCATLVEQYSGPVDLLGLHQYRPERYPFFLESNSVAQPRSSPESPYDILFAFPGEHLELRNGGLQGSQLPAGRDDFLEALDNWYAELALRAPPECNLPFTGGWFIYLGYELAAQVEPCLQLPEARPLLPTALAVRCPAAVLRDRRSNTVYAVAERAELMHALLADLRAHSSVSATALPAAVISEDEPERYLRQIARVHEYIRAGDVFQVNLSREWQASLAAPTRPADVYAALRQTNPSPFAGLMCWQGSAVISSSPERLLRLRDGWAETRPIAGTRPRVGVDAAMTRELLAHPKERAEHVMLIDLERNDLGRICEYGSVEVNELMMLESYAHVHHIVSNVRGKLRADVAPGAALRAVFPGGTITGCPKVRCMQIIAELEGSGRGAYTGTMGYLGRDGRLDSNILIRSFVQRGQQLWLRAGGGIVADSDAEKELEETRAKARGLLQSLGQLT